MKLGNITVTNEDNMELLTRSKNNQFDLAIVDPPYFNGPDKLGFFGERKSPIGVYRDNYTKIKDWGVPTADYFNELFRVSKSQIIWGVNYYEFFSFNPGRIIWDKVNSDSSFSDCEIAFCSLHNSTRLFRFMWNGMMQGKSVLEGHIMQGNKKLNEKRIHPTQKPVKLYEWLLMKYAKKGMEILDTHYGSGSIGIACDNLGYNLTACDSDKLLFEKSILRLKNHQAQLKLF